MKLTDLEDYDKIDNRFERIENKIERLENKMDARLNALESKVNALDAKVNGQRVLLIAAIIGVLAQIVNAWIVALSHLAK